MKRLIKSKLQKQALDINSLKENSKITIEDAVNQDGKSLGDVYIEIKKVNVVTDGFDFQNADIIVDKVNTEITYFMSSNFGSKEITENLINFCPHMKYLLLGYNKDKNITIE